MKAQSKQIAGKSIITKVMRAHWWKPGVSGNPGGRKKLPAEIREIKQAALEKAIVLLNNIVNDPVALISMGHANVAKYLELAFDRFGLPKVVRNEMSGPDGEPIKQKLDWSKVDEKTLKKLADEI